MSFELKLIIMLIVVIGILIYKFIELWEKFEDLRQFVLHETARSTVKTLREILKLKEEQERAKHEDVRRE